MCSNPEWIEDRVPGKFHSGFLRCTRLLSVPDEPGFDISTITHPICHLTWTKEWRTGDGPALSFYCASRMRIPCKIKSTKRHTQLTAHASKPSADLLLADDLEHLRSGCCALVWFVAAIVCPRLSRRSTTRSYIGSRATGVIDKPVTYSRKVTSWRSSTVYD